MQPTAAHPAPPKSASAAICHCQPHHRPHPLSAKAPTTNTITISAANAATTDKAACHPRRTIVIFILIAIVFVVVIIIAFVVVVSVCHRPWLNAIA
jgi:hypothetical protein